MRRLEGDLLPRLAQTRLEQIRFIRNLHRTRHARHKSLVRGAARERFSRKWFLFLGSNVDRHIVKSHELEATDNFARYANDARTESKFVLSTTRLENLPPIERYNALLHEIRFRWQVLDRSRGADKLKLMLKAAECFEDLAHSLGDGIET